MDNQDTTIRSRVLRNRNSYAADWVEFDKQCEELKEKATSDWWRIGWEFDPQTVDDVIAILADGAKAAHEAWLKAIECGDAPPEDVSPGESFARAAKLIKDMQSHLEFRGY